MFSILLFALFACTTGPEQAVLDDGVSSERIAEGSPEAFGILAFLNDAGTTFTLLDDAVALDARAARSLIAHRNGPDGVFGTADDDTYDTLAEVDDQYYVGNSAMVALLKYVERTGWIPGGDDVVGSWDGVTFTADEVTWTLDLVNTATQSELDIEIGLNSRAVDSILAGRPFHEMNSLADAYYVGGSALTTLRDYAADLADVPPVLGQVGDQCDTSAECEADLRCLGELAYDSGLFCVDTWDTFNHDEENEIPDDGTTLTTSVHVLGLASVPVDVVVTVDVVHDRPSDLVMSIDNFNGYGETLWENEDSPSMKMIVRAFPSDDAVNGTYNLYVTDTVPGVQGVLRGWELYVVSTYD